MCLYSKSKSRLSSAPARGQGQLSDGLDRQVDEGRGAARVEGLVAAAEGSVGNDAPPPPDRLEGNYFESAEPLRLKLRLDGAAAKGKHTIEAKLSYFYCVAASGFCAPAKEILRIPVTVRGRSDLGERS